MGLCAITSGEFVYRHFVRDRPSTLVLLGNDQNSSACAVGLVDLKASLYWCATLHRPQIIASELS